MACDLDNSTSDDSTENPYARSPSKHHKETPIGLLILFWFSFTHQFLCHVQRSMYLIQPTPFFKPTSHLYSSFLYVYTYIFIHSYCKVKCRASLAATEILFLCDRRVSILRQPLYKVRVIVRTIVIPLPHLQRTLAKRRALLAWSHFL